MIIHYQIIKKLTGKRYLCNQACGITPEKITDDIDKVTCKNCIKALAYKHPFIAPRGASVV